MVEDLHYKPEGRGFGSRWRHWKFSLLNPSGSTTALGSTEPLKEMSIRNVLGGKGGRCIGLTTLQLSCADFLEIWKSEPPGNLRDSQGLQLDRFTFIYFLPSSASLTQKFAVLYGPEPAVLLITTPQLLVNTERKMRTYCRG